MTQRPRLRRLLFEDWWERSMYNDEQSVCMNDEWNDHCSTKLSKELAFHVSSFTTDCTPLGCQHRSRGTDLPQAGVHGLSADCERWRHFQEAANIAMQCDFPSLENNFTIPPMGTTMLAIPRSDCGEDWPPGNFRRGSAFSVSTLECKQQSQYILQPYHLYPRKHPPPWRAHATSYP